MVLFSARNIKKIVEIINNFPQRCYYEIKNKFISYVGLKNLENYTPLNTLQFGERLPSGKNSKCYALDTFSMIRLTIRMLTMSFLEGFRFFYEKNENTIFNNEFDSDFLLHPINNDLLSTKTYLSSTFQLANASL